MTDTIEQAVRRLVELRNQLASQVEALQGRIAGLDSAVELLGRTSDEVVDRPAKGRGVTDLLLQFLNDAGYAGLNARIATEMAAERGLELNQQSVSSLLSRLRKSGAIVHHQRRYRLARFAGPFGSSEREEQRAAAA